MAFQSAIMMWKQNLIKSQLTSSIASISDGNIGELAYHQREITLKGTVIRMLYVHCSLKWRLSLRKVFELSDHNSYIPFTFTFLSQDPSYGTPTVLKKTFTFTWSQPDYHMSQDSKQWQWPWVNIIAKVVTTYTLFQLPHSLMDATIIGFATQDTNKKII